MKFLLIVPLVAIICSVYAQHEPLAVSDLTARIKFEESLYDFGDIMQGEVVTHTFTFENIGSETLVISNVLTTCGCTATDWPRQPIEPGKRGQIKASFNTNGKLGKQAKIITVVSNAENMHEKVSLISNVLPKPMIK